jgi:hypothetical protein
METKQGNKNNKRKRRKIGKKKRKTKRIGPSGPNWSRQPIWGELGMPGRVCECVDWWGHPSFPALLAFFGLVPMSRGTLVSGFHSPLSTRALDSSLARGSGVASRSLNPPSAGRACLVPRTSRGPLFSVLLSQSQQNQQSRHGRWDFGSRGSRPNPFPRGGYLHDPTAPSSSRTQAARSHRHQELATLWGERAEKFSLPTLPTFPIVARGSDKGREGLQGDQEPDSTGWEARLHTGRAQLLVGFNTPPQIRPALGVGVPAPSSSVRCLPLCSLWPLLRLESYGLEFRGRSRRVWSLRQWCHRASARHERSGRRGLVGWGGHWLLDLDERLRLEVFILVRGGAWEPFDLDLRGESVCLAS